MKKINNYAEICKLLKTFFEKYRFIAIKPTNLITNNTFNYGLKYEDTISEDKIVLDKIFVIQKCSRIEDIQYANNICVLPIFHIFASSYKITMDMLLDFFTYLIKIFGLDPSKFYLETTHSLSYLVKKIESTCGINKVKYFTKNIAQILNNGSGSLIQPYGSPTGLILPAMSINYILGEPNSQNSFIEIVQLTEFINDNDITYGVGVGIERLYTAINFNVSGEFIPNWINTLPLFIEECNAESKKRDIPLPIGYNLITKTDPSNIPCSCPK